MADEQDQTRSLEAPKLFRRGKRADAAASAEPPAAATRPTVFEADDDTRVLPDTSVPPSDVPVSTTPNASSSTPAKTPAKDTAAPAAKGTSPSNGASAGRRVAVKASTKTSSAGGLIPDARVAAAVSGALAGLALVVLVRLGFLGCTIATGADTCGTGPGLLLIVAVFILGVVAGSRALAFFKQPDPGSTSFLAVGLTAVIALLFLLDHLDSWVMVIVIPLLTAVTMLGSWFVTTHFVDEGRP